MRFKQFFVKNQKLIQWFVTIACLIGAAVMIAVGHLFFQDRPRLFVVFAAYIVILTGIVILFARRLIVMIAERE